MEYVKDKLSILEADSKNKDITGLFKDIHYFKKAYQLRSNLIKDQSGVLLADSRSIFKMWKN
jgi:hypothetical protein